MSGRSYLRAEIALFGSLCSILSLELVSEDDLGRLDLGLGKS